MPQAYKRRRTSDQVSTPFSLVKHQISSTGEPCCRHARKPSTPNMSELIRQYKIPRKPTSLIRTGCVPCLQDQVRCDGSNPHCRKATISDAWRVNLDWTRPPFGTWRERRGLHTFVSFALARERVGLFESTFWHRAVMHACFSHGAVFHVASAIGALHEHILRQSSAHGALDSDGSAFALHQCNRAINLLIDYVGDKEHDDHDPGIPLVACVLFAIFEALHGEPEQAINHSLQGRKLLKHCEELETAGRGSRLVESINIWPVIGSLEIQAKALQGKQMQTSDKNEAPTLPNVERIHSLDHANWTLHSVYISLLVFCQSVRLDASRDNITARIAFKAHYYSPWFREWEKKFAEFLFTEAKNLSLQDMQRAKVLKANHLTASMLANVDQGDTKSGWDKYDAECKAVIDLSASVLNTFTADSDTTLSFFQFPFLSFGLWVGEPLFYVMSRCCNPEYRRQAAGLLLGQTRPRIARQILDWSRQGTTLDPEDGCKDTDEWGLEEWLDFAVNTRLDAAAATYFARLPSGYIEKPVFHPDEPSWTCAIEKCTDDWTVELRGSNS